jgi:hypothetical protein
MPSRRIQSLAVLRINPQIRRRDLLLMELLEQDAVQPMQYFSWVMGTGFYRLHRNSSPCACSRWLSLAPIQHYPPQLHRPRLQRNLQHLIKQPLQRPF